MLPTKLKLISHYCANFEFWLRKLGKIGKMQKFSLLHISFLSSVSLPIYMAIKSSFKGIFIWNGFYMFLLLKKYCSLSIIRRSSSININSDITPNIKKDKGQYSNDQKLFNIILRIVLLPVSEEMIKTLIAVPSPPMIHCSPIPLTDPILCQISLFVTKTGHHYQ